ncbi:hypothetical protein EKO29_03525 [Colwellia sp. Arc7-635]|uniref:hypothetical protein n=1 Tax=Colwellia sp. Arc7-635 TaxID=2497879 RepID=UPI000F857D72|nr:hypothetical protein [Colwellia sp. Arc7-635]AZQ83208.1 hypothetical protein EKO29_03525 [Colwellia sp. Arc7-635]
MSAPRSFIDYMKIMRENYKSGASNIDKLPAGFTFDDIEIDDSLYGFVSNNKSRDHSASLISNSEYANKTAKYEQISTPKITDIITIELFDHDSMLMNKGRKSSKKMLTGLALKERISAFFQK